MTYILRERNLIVELYDVRNPNAEETAMRAVMEHGIPISSASVRNIARERGLPIRSRGGKTRGASDDEIRQSFMRYEGDCDSMAVDLGYFSDEALRRRVKRLGLI